MIFSGKYSAVHVAVGKREPTVMFLPSSRAVLGGSLLGEGGSIPSHSTLRTEGQDEMPLIA